MKKLSYIFIISLIFVFTGCVKDSTLIQRTYENISKQDALRFEIEVDHTNINNEQSIYGVTYDVNHPSVDDVTVYTQKNQMIFYNGSYDKQYIRVEGDEVTLFSHYINSYVHNRNFTEEKITRTKWDETNSAVHNILDNSYFSLLINYSDIAKVREETLKDQTTVSVFKINSDSYNIWSHPYVSSLFEEITKSTDLTFEELISTYNKDLEFLVYIDENTYEIRQIEVDLTNVLLAIQDDYSDNYFVKNNSTFQDLKQHIIRYKISSIGDLDVSLPLEFNYYEKTTNKIKESFNSIWNDSTKKLKTANTVHILENLYGKFSTSYTSSNSSSTTNIDLTLDIGNEPFIYKKTIGDQSSYITFEDGVYYSYKKEGSSFIKSPMESSDKIIDVKDLIPINRERMREDIKLDQNEVTYSYTLNYEDLKDYLLVTDLLENYMQDNIDLTDTPEIYISITFNKDNRILKEIKIDYTKFLDSIYVPLSDYNRMDNVDDFIITFSLDLSQNEISTSFIDNSVVDDHHY